MKITIAELIDWYKNGFPKKYVMEDFLDTDEDFFEKMLDENCNIKQGVDVLEKVDPDQIFILCEHGNENNQIKPSKLIKKWLKNKNIETVILIIPKTKTSKVLDLIKNIEGIKIQNV